MTPVFLSRFISGGYMYKKISAGLSLLLLSSALFASNPLHTRHVLSKKIYKHAEKIGIVRDPETKEFDNQELDNVAKDYCKTHPKTFIAIIWPRGESFIDAIKSIMSTKCNLLYQKTFFLENDGPKFLDQWAHPRQAVSRILKNAINYIPVGMVAPYKFHTLLFKTDMSLFDIINMKNVIRTMVGASYFSIHIDDYNSESQNLAQMVFDDMQLDAICHKVF